MKWQPVSVSLMALTLLAAGVLLVQQQPFFFRPELFTPEYTGEDLQLGYYDLLYKNRELYNARFDTRGKVVMMTLSSPNDNRFRMKVRLEQRTSDPQGVRFDYKPVYISSPNEENMIANILGYMPRNGVLFDGFMFREERIVVTPAGQIVSYR